MKFYESNEVFDNAINIWMKQLAKIAPHNPLVKIAAPLFVKHLEEKLLDPKLMMDQSEKHGFNVNNLFKAIVDGYRNLDPKVKSHYFHPSYVNFEPGQQMDKIKLICLLIAVFSVGWLLNAVLTNFVYYDVEKPLSFSIVPFFSSPEIDSPSDHIKEEQIHVYNDKVVIDVAGATWAAFADTNSMDPFLDESSNSIEVKPSTPESIKEGDIISYYSSITGDLLVHRVVSVDSDDKGVFYIVKGDNNNIRDPEKVRFHQVHGVLVGIIY